ncbi:unconventional myosin-XIX-like [Asterias rubens]|uniref:unconventional myosin-XIX-like n=1 Tax=Asterias rubens TaxID=7604 RepID=UPI0014550D88|nr:unconventional myosin-XIX-like [Asterias rubens]
MAAPLKAVTSKIGNIFLDSKKEWRKKPRKATPQKRKPQYREGLDVWVRDPTEVWLPASVTSVEKDGSLCIKLSSGQESVVTPKGDYPSISGNLKSCEETDDLTALNPLCEAAVLHCLRSRFHTGAYSTSAGITLIAVNPFREVKGCYGEEAVQSYREGAVKTKAPHVYAVAERAYSQMEHGVGPLNQSIIVSGESGAGKTWTARCLMKYLATVAVYNPGGFEPSPGDCIERRILDSNPILEAFGNAGTARNHNSSRFGKYIQLQFDRGQHIIGASIQTYLLEKTRVVHQSSGERNFHIFYQLYHGSTAEEKEWLGLGKEDHSLRYLPVGDGKAEVLEDHHAFRSTRAAMTNVGLSANHQRDIFQVLSGLLHLGNICFTSDGELEPCEVDEDNKDYLLSSKFATELLGLDPEQLEKCLMFRKITASHSKRKSIFMRPCTAEEAGNRRDCMAKLLYARLFVWLVTFINKTTCAGQWRSFIGLLDIYGFESFQSNSLEQLCINYANEKLQQHFVAHFLRSEQEEYTAEGIPWHLFSFTDNQPCLDVIEGKSSVFSLMNEECRLNRQRDVSAFGSRLVDGIRGSYICKPPVSVRHAAFVIKHYAQDVTYSVDGLIEKNKDHIPIELIELAASSANPFVCDLVQIDLAGIQNQSGKNGKVPAKTVVSKFKTSLDSLMGTLRSTAPHYIRCIKPNLTCQPGDFDSNHVVSQLRACGVLETIAISAKGFPARMPYTEFYDRYRVLHLNGGKMNGEESSGSREASKRMCVSVMERIFHLEEDRENEPATAQFGKTKIFLRDGQLEELEGQRALVMSKVVTCIQRWWRRYLKQQSDRQLKAAVLIQAAYRGWKVRECLVVMNDAARVIQQAMLEFCIRRQQMREELEARQGLLLGHSDDGSLLEGETSQGSVTQHDGSLAPFDDSTSSDEEFMECRDRLSGVESLTRSSPCRKSETLRTLSGGLLDLTAPTHHHQYGLFSAGILPRRCSKTQEMTSRVQHLEDHYEDDLDEDDDTLESGTAERMAGSDETRRTGLSGTLIGILKKPAVDFALGAIVTALLLKGPVQL